LTRLNRLTDSSTLTLHLAHVTARVNPPTFTPNDSMSLTNAAASVLPIVARASTTRTKRSSVVRRRSSVLAHAASAERVEKIRATGLSLDVFDGAEIERGVAAMRSIDPDAFASAPDWLLAWFLRDRKLDADKASDKAKKYLEWRANEGYDDLDTPAVAEEAATKKAVLLEERDVCGRPVVYVTLTRHEVETRELERTCKLCVKLVDEALERLRAEGEGANETIMCVFDLRGFTMKNADIDFVKFFIKCIFDYFPKRISQVLLIEPPWVFTPVWQIIKPLMGKYAALVKQVKAKEAKEFFADESTLF